jgi:hypothetical protein
MHIVYHHVPGSGGGTAKTDFRGTWEAAMDWMAERRKAGDTTNYYMKVR